MYKMTCKNGLRDRLCAMCQLQTDSACLGLIHEPNNYPFNALREVHLSLVDSYLSCGGFTGGGLLCVSDQSKSSRTQTQICSTPLILTGGYNARN